MFALQAQLAEMAKLEHARQKKVCFCLYVVRLYSQEEPPLFVDIGGFSRHALHLLY